LSENGSGEDQNLAVDVLYVPYWPRSGLVLSHFPGKSPGIVSIGRCRSARVRAVPPVAANQQIWLLLFPHLPGPHLFSNSLFFSQTHTLSLYLSRSLSLSLALVASFSLSLVEAVAAEHRSCLQTRAPFIHSFMSLRCIGSILWP